MSVSGSIGRTLSLCSVEWIRNIPEQGPTNSLLPGWNMKITLPFIDLHLEKLGKKVSFFSFPVFWASRSGIDIYYAGYGVGVLVDNGNTGELWQSGDSTVLG